jgi:hypothetical protein
MKDRTVGTTTAVLFIVGCILLTVFDHFEPAIVHAQQPTGSIPTVTGTPPGPFVKVDQSVSQVRVYSGPSSFDYPAVGVLVAGETAPALARARGREDWIKIHYPGVPGSIAWVFGLFVSLSPGAALPLEEIPPTPTLAATPTINPTLEAAFIGQQTPTRLPTFTPPAPVEPPTFNDVTETQPPVPAGLAIVVLALVGFMGALISYLRGR